MEAQLIVPVQEIARGKPKFGIWAVVGDRVYYIRMKEGTWGDAFRRGLIYGGAYISIYTAAKARAQYEEAVQNYLSSIELPPDFVERIDDYAKESTRSFSARIEETSVKRGKGFLGNEANGQTPVELKCPNGSIKFYVATETFEKIKPKLQTLPFREYREARLWVF
ncbi:MAG: hypothetical protein H0Z18_08885 [Thermococcus sp.]|uniref:hypothetical protein n=1 Tax=Thermococcus sp. TaxID=35749 RepID=UPI001DF5DF3B|nr:hypothetical protein [Thermococcus sp.]MBO8175359.1 hypothetical protein [Thermococcus sp.]